MQGYKGYKGKLLFINLTEGSSEIKPLPEEIARLYVGGRGLGARLLYDLLPKGTDPLSPDNVFMVLTGPLTGTIAPGSSKHVVVTRSPATGTYLDTYSSSRLSWELKFAGFDGIVIRGKAPNPSYLWICDDKVEVRDAGFLWGKDNFETEDMVKEVVGDDLIGIITIGPAAENGVKIATLNSDYYRQAARGGGGLVMASKNLKAIAVKGTGGVSVADLPGILEIERRYLENARTNPRAAARSKYGTPLTIRATNAGGILPTRNFQQGTFPEAEGTIDTEAVYKQVIATKACSSCISPCGKVVQPKFGLYAGSMVEGPEYETLAMLGANLGMTDLSVIVKGNEVCDRLGLDTISAGVAVGFAMECYEKGLITKEQANGYDLRFGNGEAAIGLLEDIAYRRGLGDVLAEGVREAARVIGHGSDRFAMHVKGLEFAAYDPRGAFGAGLAYAVCPRGACHRRAWPPAHEILGNVPPYTDEGKPELVRQMYNENCYLHCLVLCDFVRFLPVEGDPYKEFPRLLSHYADYLSRVVGWEYTDADLFDVAERTETMIRLFNVREGFSRKDDTLPWRTLEEPMSNGPAKGQAIGEKRFNRMLDEYYQIRGWDENGRPKPETLSKYKIDKYSFQ